MSTIYTIPSRVSYSPNGYIYLSPRPLAAQAASFILVPLLPSPLPVKQLPAEVWSVIFEYALFAKEDGACESGRARQLMCLNKCMRVCLQVPILDTFTKQNPIGCDSPVNVHVYLSSPVVFAGIPLFPSPYVRPEVGLHPPDTLLRARTMGENSGYLSSIVIFWASSLCVLGDATSL
jgi:hypothetical protein